MNKRGISPVIATVILIAVVVVIAMALAGFYSNMFGSWIETSNTNSTQIISPYQTGYHLGLCPHTDYIYNSSREHSECMEGKLDRLIEMIKEK